MKALIVVQHLELGCVLESMAREVGFEPTLINDPGEACKAFQSTATALVILSLRSPEIDCKTLCQELRKLDREHRAIILVLTEHGSAAELQSAIDAGADDFILWPMEPPLLRIRLQIAARRVNNRIASVRVKEQLQESVERFELAVRGANDGLWDAQFKGQPWGRPDTVVWFSPRYKELLGYSEDEYPHVMESWLSRLHPDDRDRIFQAVDEHLEHKRLYDVEYRLLTKSGEYRWFSARGQGTWDEQGKLQRMSGSLRDITQIKDYETKLQQSEAVWRSLVENAPDIIILADLDGTIKFINRHTEIATESIGRTVYDYLDEPSKEPMRAALQAIRETKRPQQFEVRGLSEHGEAGIWYANRLGPIWNNDEVEAVVLIASDITARKVAEERVQREQQLLRRLLDLLEKERKLVAYEIHDGLVQYLTAALMHLEAFAASHQPANAQAQSEYDYGQELLREALGEGRRLISGLRPPILDERGVVDALHYLVSEAKPFISDIEFVNDTHFGRLAAPLEVAIFRVAQEALSNIRLHSGAARARVELLQRGDMVRLVVRDWGRGFDPAQVQEERFGLHGIRERTRLLGTTAQIESAPGQGTAITVEFPLIPEKAAPTA